jgi:hypothetical protein
MSCLSRVSSTGHGSRVAGSIEQFTLASLLFSSSLVSSLFHSCNAVHSKQTMSLCYLEAS